MRKPTPTAKRGPFGRVKRNGAIHGKNARPAAAGGTNAITTSFPIVGIGASAGGLEALEEFFLRVSSRIGMAFVVVTHQHPGHISLLAELLGKQTEMKVMTALDGERAQPNCVYLSRAEHCLRIFNGVLHLMEFKEPEDSHLPIDYFFCSLAEDQDRRAVGIVLSGTGTDGTRGIRAIKEAGGITMAQEQESAKYSGMPLSAIGSGMVDYVLPPGRMPEKLERHVRGAFGSASGPLSDDSIPDRLQKIIYLLRSRTGHDFSVYKAATVSRRVERRMTIHKLKNATAYLGYLQKNAHETDLLFNELLIGVTNFFRDPEAFASLAKKAVAALLKARPEGSIIRAWVPGCSTGEEAYTLAIVLHECAERLQKRVTLQIFGTDLDSQAINFARNGLYPAAIAKDVPPEYLLRYFVKEGQSYRVKKSVRELVVFAPQNLLKDPPFTKLDLISCRNLLIYLNALAQKHLLGLFHYALRARGVLMLGPSENLGDFAHYFGVVDKKWRIFTRKETPQLYLPMLKMAGGPAQVQTQPPAAVLPVPAGTIPDSRVAAVFDRLLGARFIPPSVIINAHGDISYIYGRTGDYLEPAAGQPRLNLLEMAREGLRMELTSAIHRAETRGEVVREEAQMKLDGGVTGVVITVNRLREPDSVRGLLLVTFQSAPVHAATAKAARVLSKREATRLQELERELQFTRESLRSTVEELQSSNEELQSTNEELQSSNEELETSREEMQSLNEELQTLNAQLQSKVDALSQTNDDMQNLLNSTSIATIFLDMQLRIKRFTEQAKSVINLIASDVGRPIGDLVSKLNYEGFEADAAQVLRTLNFREREVQAKHGDWRLVRILPYRTTDNVIDGLVVTFLDINAVKQAEQAAQQARMYSEGIVSTLREPVLVLDTKLRVVSANRSFYRFFRLKPANVEKRPIYELSKSQWDIPELRGLLKQVLRQDSIFEDFRMARNFSRVGFRELALNARRLQQEDKTGGLILLAMEDVTGQKRPERGQGR